jgi:hypothetical protein
MQRLLLPLILLGLGALPSLGDRSTYDTTKTQMALPLETAPTIDGIIETVEWERAGGAAGNFWIVQPNLDLEDGVRGGTAGDVANAPADSTDLSFFIYAGFDANNLYLAIRVTDSVIITDSAEAESANGNTWMDDSVEVFIDGDNSNFETRDTSGTNPAIVGSGGQYVITANNAYRDAEAGSPGMGEGKPWIARTTPRDDGSGYDAEFRIALSALGNPKPGDIIGFTVGVNDDDDGDVAERQVLWVGSTHTESTYGNLLLGVRAYEAPKTAAPTIDGVINASEYPGAQLIKVETHTAIYDLTAGDDTFAATDSGFSAWAVHDADAIYVAIDAIDDLVVNDTAEAGSEDGSTWEDDSVEIFFDADFDRELGRGSAGPFEGQYVLSANGAWRDAEANNPAFGEANDWFAATSKTAGGFQVEFKVNKSALGSPADGATLGFQIAQNDDDGAGRRAQPAWSGRAHSEFTYGTIQLAGAAPSGPVQINTVKVSGNNLELAIATPNCTGSHTVEKSAPLGGAWSAVSGVTAGPCQGGVITLTFPKPTASAEFYRVVLR